VVEIYLFMRLLLDMPVEMDIREPVNVLNEVACYVCMTIALIRSERALFGRKAGSPAASEKVSNNLRRSYAAICDATGGGVSSTESLESRGFALRGRTSSDASVKPRSAHTLWYDWCRKGC